MDYEKKYPITQQPGEFIIARWERGYKYVELYYKDRLIGSVTGTGKLRAGVTLKDDYFHTIRLKLSEKPVMLDLVIDGYHSPVNVDHPVKDLKKMAVFFWIISTFSVILGIQEVAMFQSLPSLLIGVIIIDLVITGTYVTAGAGTRAGKPWAYFLGLGMFCLLFLPYLYFTYLVGAFMLYIYFAIRIGGLCILLYNIKTVTAARKHLKYGTYSNDELLDSK